MRFEKPLSVAMSAAMLMAFTPAAAAFAADQDNQQAYAQQAQEEHPQQKAGQGETLGTYRIIDKAAKTAEFVSSQVEGTAATVPATITLDDGVEYSVIQVGDKAFWGMQKLASVKVENGVTSIGERAFEECVNLESVSLPNSVSSLGDKAFFYCSRLAGITLPASLTKVSRGAFYGCASLKSLDIPSNVTSIDNYAFAECGAVEKVTGAKNVTSIGARAFKRCRAMESFPFNEGLTSIGDRAFEECQALRKVDLPKSLAILGEYAFSDCQEITELSVSVPEISRSAFSNCSSITSLTLGEGVQKIDDFAFDGSLESALVIPKTLKEISPLGIYCPMVGEFKVEKGSESFSAQDGVLYNADGTTLVKYPGKSTAKSFAVPSSVEKIADYAFQGADELKSVDLGDVSELGKNAFYGAAFLKNVTFSKNLTSIPEGAFGSTNISALSLPNSIKEIGDSAFSSTAVKTLDLGSVEKIGDDAFSGAYKLNEVTIPATATDVAGNFASGSNVTAFKVASGSASYKAKKGLLYSADGKTLVSVPTSYNKKQSKPTVSVAKGCEVIGSNSFEGSTAFKVSLPTTVTTIQTDAFKQTENLYMSGVEIPSSVTTIEDYSIGYISGHEDKGRDSAVLIVGKRGSAAESYALANDFAFATTTPKMKIAKATLAKKGKKTTVSVKGMVNGQVKYYSSNTNVVKVNKKGRVTAVGAGKTNIVAAMGTYYMHVNVSVGGKKASANNNPYKSYTALDGKKALKAWQKKYYAANKGISFTKKSNPGINCYTSNDYVAIKYAQGDKGYEQRAKEAYGTDVEEYKEVSDLLKWELSRFNLPVNTELYSGIGSVYAYTGAASTLDDMENSKGKTLTHPILISTSVFGSIAEGFGNGTYGTTIHIYAPKNKTLGGYLYKFSQYPDEYELLLANDAQFKVVDCGVKYAKIGSPYSGKRYNSYQRYYTLEYLGNSAL